MGFSNFYFCKTCAYYRTDSKICKTCPHYLNYYISKKETDVYKKVLNRKSDNGDNFGARNKKNFE